MESVPSLPSASLDVALSDLFRKSALACSCRRGRNDSESSLVYYSIPMTPGYQPITTWWHISHFSQGISVLNLRVRAFGVNAKRSGERNDVLWCRKTECNTPALARRVVPRRKLLVRTSACSHAHALYPMKLAVGHA